MVPSSFLMSSASMNSGALNSVATVPDSVTDVSVIVATASDSEAIAALAV